MTKLTVDERLTTLERKMGVGAKTTRILVIQDKSGSMYSRLDETISGFNEYLEDLAKDESDEAFLTLIQFDKAYKVVEESTPVAKVESLTEKTYQPGGSTALLDAVGRGVTDLKNELGDDERALVIIMTDGQENSSSEYNSGAVKNLIKECEKKGNWTFIFLGASQDAWSGGDLLGIRRNQAVYYGADSHTHGLTYASLGAHTHGLRRGVAMASASMGDEVSLDMAQKGGDVNVASPNGKKKETSGTGS